MTAHNQDWALSHWRKDTAKSDPAYYTLRGTDACPSLWLRVNGNDGWYTPVIRNGGLVGLKDEAHGSNARVMKYVSPKQARKIVEMVTRVT